MFQQMLNQHLECFSRLPEQRKAIETAGERMTDIIAGGGKILVCGNGGSAADAQHFAAELVGRFEQERSAWPAIALTTDSSIVTAIGNDYGFSDIFARQVQGLGRRGDALIGISTSGRSENVLRAMAAAKTQGLFSVGLLGREGGTLKNAVDCAIVVGHSNTARIQEAHIFILHFWAMLIERKVTLKNE